MRPMTAVSVLVATMNPGSLLPGLVRSVDGQTLPLTDFELVVADASDDGSADRLQQLAGRRPNVTVLDAHDAEADRLGSALEHATGEYLLVVDQQQRLAPRALELLLERARSTGADVVVGRVVTRSSSGSAALPDDADRVEAAELDPAGCIALVRRSLLTDLPDAAAALRDPATLIGAAGTVSALGRYASAIQDRSTSAPGGAAVIGSPTYRWEGGALRVAVRVRLGEPGSEGLAAWLVVADERAEIALPASIDRVDGDDATLTLAATVDPRTAEGGRPLDDGPWSLRFRLVRSGREGSLPLGPAPSRSGAVVAGRPHVVRAVGGLAHLDVGATGASVVGRVPASRASVVESVQGALVTLEYPDLHVHGDAVLNARLLLDGFALPARLVCSEGGARLESYVGTLAGDPEVAVLAGGGKPAQTGLRLRVDGAGGMVFAKAPARRSEDPATPSSGVPVVQRLRRRIPGALDPVVHRLATVPVLRRTYRRLLSR